MQSNNAGPGGATSGSDNIPGFTYFERVAAAAGRAVNANTRIVNDAWQDINQRRYDTGAAMHTSPNHYPNWINFCGTIAPERFINSIRGSSIFYPISREPPAARAPRST